MLQRFFYKKYALISLIAFNSICCFAQEPEIKSSPKYYDRSIINRILDKEQLENKSPKFSIESTKEGPIAQPAEEISSNSFNLTTF